jgi:hypothetical protein
LVVDDWFVFRLSDPNMWSKNLINSEKLLSSKLVSAVFLFLRSIRSFAFDNYFDFQLAPQSLRKLMLERNSLITHCSIIIYSEGDAEYAKLIMEATKLGPAFVELRQLETTKEVVAKLAKSKNITYLPSQGNVLMNLPTK